MAHFVFAHGWGFDSGVWNKLRTLFPPEMTSTFELGYFGSPAQTPRPDCPFIAVGHSAGFARVLQRDSPGCVGWIAINGFARFVASPAFACGVAPRTIDRMQTAMARDPLAVLRDFRTRCGTTEPWQGAPDSTRLTEGLSELVQADVMARLQGIAERTAVLAGDEDPIVTPEMTRDSFAPSIDIEWVQGGGHLLPLSAPLQCAHVLRVHARKLGL